MVSNARSDTPGLSSATSRPGSAARSPRRHIGAADHRAARRQRDPGPAAGRPGGASEQAGKAGSGKGSRSRGRARKHPGRGPAPRADHGAVAPAARAHRLASASVQPQRETLPRDPPGRDVGGDQFSSAATESCLPAASSASAASSIMSRRWVSTLTAAVSATGVRGAQRTAHRRIRRALSAPVGRSSSSRSRVRRGARLRDVGGEAMEIDRFAVQDKEIARRFVSSLRQAHVS